MTIAIAAHGPNAGLAVVKALSAVERVASGSIGGFAVFAALDDDGVLYRAQTQRGGSATLFVDGETTGNEPDCAAARAGMAGIVSSGPDRPAPLDQFLPAAPHVGLVTGHRLPNSPGHDGVPVNLGVLDHMRRGRGARAAVDAVLEANPGVDAGIIAIDARGEMYSRDSTRVRRRPDIGRARCEDRRSGAVVEVLHNSIFPVTALASLAAGIALDVMTAARVVAGHVEVRAGIPVIAGEEDRVVVGDDGIAARIETTDHRITQGHHNCAAIYLGSRVLHEGRTLGFTILEPNVVMDAGKIASMSGQTVMRIGYRTASPGPAGHSHEDD